jgi:CheY-like chemotaxis protein
MRPEPLHEIHRLHGVRILVVDDDRDSRELLATVFELEGAIVTGVPSAAEALQVLQHERPDVLVSDLSMPGQDGYWLIDRVRALPTAQGGATPAAALTGWVTAEDRAAVLRAGFQFHVPKPARLSQLVGIVALLALKGPRKPFV